MDLVVYTIVASGLGIVNTVIMLFMAYKFLHTYQLNNYHLIRLFHWYGRTNGIYFKRLVLICLLSLAGLFVTNTLFYGYAHEIFTYLGIAFYFVLSILFVHYEGKIPKKKPLVYTRRMIRQYVVLTLLILGANVLIFYFNRIIMLKGGAYYNFRFTLIALSPLVLPILVLLSCLLTAPFEQLNNNRYVKKARKILEKREDLIKIGITGSYAKTTVKVILSKLLSKKYKVLATPASYNTPMGISACVSKIKPYHEVFIAEMGARNSGNVKELCDIVKPNYGIITGISNQHLETFYNISNIIKTKCELADAIGKNNGSLVVNSDTKYLQEVKDLIKCEYSLCGVDGEENLLRIENVTTSCNGSEFDLVVGVERVRCKTSMLGKHNISNIAVASGIAIQLGVSLSEISELIAELTPPAHRLELLKTPNGMIILDDTFNANIEGATAALSTLKMFEGRKVIVTPGLVELGVEEIQTNVRFGKMIAEVCDLVILIGAKRSEPIRRGLIESNFDEKNILVYNSLSDAKSEFKDFLRSNDAVLLENDLPDDYNEINELK